MRDDLAAVRERLTSSIDEWLIPAGDGGPVDSEIAFIRSCAALYSRMCATDPDLATDEDALTMLQSIAVEILRPRVGSRMRTASEGAVHDLSLGTAEAVAAARLAAAGRVRDVLVTTSIMSQGIECTPWDHIRGVPAYLWVLPAICSAVSPDEFFSEDALADEPPPASYWFSGEKGTLWFRLAYEIRALRPGISDEQRKQFRAWAYENWVLWAEAHEFSDDFPDPLRSSTFDISFTERAYELAAHVRGIKLGEFAASAEATVRYARVADDLGQMHRQTLQAAHLYYWAATESHLLLDTSDDLDAVLREHPWVAQWYPEALEDPANDPDPIWPPDKEVLVQELDRRVASSDPAPRHADRNYSRPAVNITPTSASPSRPRRPGPLVVIGSAAAVLALGAILWAGIAKSGQLSEAGGLAPSSPISASPSTTSQAPTPAPGASHTALAAVTDVCKGTRGDTAAGDIVEVRLTHDPARGRLGVRFRLAQPLDTSGDDAALLLIIASADNTRSYQLGVNWLDGELAGTWVSDMGTGQETHPSNSGVSLSGSTVTVQFPDDAVLDLGPGWQWMAASSINSTDMDGCPSDEYEFRTFPGE